MLRTIKLGETDRIVTILTQGHGKVRAVAKGVRKSGSRFGARLEPTSHIALQCYRGRELDVVTQVETIDANRALREHYGCLTHAISMLEATDQVAQEREANPALYRMLVGALRTLAENPNPLVSAAFFWKLLSLEGFHPLLDACARCGDEDGPVHRVRPRRGWGAVHGVRPLRGPAHRRRHPRRWSGASSAASCGARWPSRPGPRPWPPSGSRSPASSTTSSAVCAARHCCSRGGTHRAGRPESARRSTVDAREPLTPVLVRITLRRRRPARLRARARPGPHARGAHRRRHHQPSLHRSAGPIPTPAPSTSTSSSTATARGAVGDRGAARFADRRGRTPREDRPGTRRRLAPVRL